MLFCPNELVYHWHKLTEQHQILRCERLKHVKTREAWYWEVICTVVANDGIAFGIAREPLELRIPQFEGAKDISTLPVLPVRFKDDFESMRMQLLERGRAYIDAFKQGKSYFEVSGLAMKEPKNIFDEEDDRKARDPHLAENDEKNFIKFTVGHARSLKLVKLLTPHRQMDVQLQIRQSFGCSNPTVVSCRS